MHKSIGITISKFSYTPEAYAYADFLSKKGYEIQLAEAENLDSDLDVHVYFMGLLPFWKKKGAWREIHEYQSLSTPVFPRTKDYIKKLINRNPDGRIFLNKVVREKLDFNSSVPYIYRDMGVDGALFQQPSENPTYDVVYCGSIDGRVGLVQEILRLACMGFKILVIGHVSNAVRSAFLNFKNNIEFVGRVDRQDLPALYRECRSGLNYTPDIYPFNIQTSTKTLEYLASGLFVISNRYSWVENFSYFFSDNFLWLDSLSYDKFQSFSYMYNDLIESFSWDVILKENNFHQFLVEGI